MEKYPKIKTVFKRDMENKGRIIEAEWNCPEFQYLRDNIWVFTEKIDGTNVRVGWDGDALRFGGRTDNAQIPTFLIEKLQELFTNDKLARAFSEEWKSGIDAQVCLYGEGYGAKIQKGGKYISDGVNFILFDVLVANWWLKRADIEDVANKLNINIVPIVGAGTLDEGIKKVKDSFNSEWGEFPAEGLVMKPEVELKTRAGNRIITKIKHKDFYY